MKLSNMQLKIRTPKEDFFDSAMKLLPHIIKELSKSKDAAYELYKMGQFIQICEEEDTNPIPDVDHTDTVQDILVQQQLS